MAERINPKSNNMKKFRFLLLAAAVIPAVMVSSCGPKQLSDKQILELIYAQAGGDQWSDYNKEGWLTEENIDDWKNVDVNEEGRVVRLSIYGGKGVIPAEISGLTELEELNIVMDNDDDEGDPVECIPASIGKLEKLRELYLNVSVPCAVPPLDNMPLLEDLNLRFYGGAYPEAVSGDLYELVLNGFAGEIPAWVYDKVNLKVLSINTDKLEGGLAPEIANLSSLERLNVDNSRFIGGVDVPNTELPVDAIFSLKDLKYIFLRSISTSGVLPAEIGNMPELKSMILCDLGLTGELPKELGDLPKIETLEIYRNELTGQIPPELFNAVTLKQLWLDHNHLSGPLPKEIGNLVNLESIELSYNELSGSIPAELAKCTKLGKGVFNDFTNNQFSPDLPEQVKAMPYFSELKF